VGDVAAGLADGARRHRPHPSGRHPFRRGRPGRIVARHFGDAEMIHIAVDGFPQPPGRWRRPAPVPAGADVVQRRSWRRPVFPGG
jgi:hypothetical protein